jgi:uncharacterized protein
MRRVIDFRVRPPIAGFEAGRMYSRPERTAQMGEAFGFPVPSRILREPSLATFESELRESGIELAVVPGRVGAPDVGPANNEALIEYARSAPGVFACSLQSTRRMGTGAVALRPFFERARRSSKA